MQVQEDTIKPCCSVCLSIRQMEKFSLIHPRVLADVKLCSTMSEIERGTCKLLTPGTNIPEKVDVD